MEAQELLCSPGGHSRCDHMKSGVAAGVWFHCCNVSTFSAGAFTPSCPMSRRWRTQHGPGWEFAVACLRSPPPPAFKTNRRYENSASRKMCEEGNKKTKWSECPEAQLGVCRAATVNKQQSWCPVICHLTQPTAQARGGEQCHRETHWLAGLHQSQQRDKRKEGR